MAFLTPIPLFLPFIATALMSLKSLLYLTLLMVSTQAVAQVRYAALIGPQATTASYKVNGQSQPTSFKPGVMAGLGIKIPFDNQFYFFPSFYYRIQGYPERKSLSSYRNCPEQ
jgi:hypothetical protein